MQSLSTAQTLTELSLGIVRYYMLKKYKIYMGTMVHKYWEMMRELKVFYLCIIDGFIGSVLSGPHDGRLTMYVMDSARQVTLHLFR